MGQVIGNAVICSEAKPFMNAPRKHLFELWEAFNLVAEGFGLTLPEVKEMFQMSFKDYLGITDKRLCYLTEALFSIFDHDDKKLIDSLEFFSAMALISAMSWEQKVMYIFTIYDFNETGALTIDEMTLALRASVSGACRISRNELPEDSRIDKLTATAFDLSARNCLEKNLKVPIIQKDAFISCMINLPETCSWLQGFSDFDDPTIIEPSTHLPFLLKVKNKIEKRITDYETKGTERSWQDMVQLAQPSDLKTVPISDMSKSTVELEWVYGMNTVTYGGNFPFYCSNGDVVYPAGSIVVKLDRNQNESWNQTYYMDHTDYITCFAVHTHKQNAKLVATGDTGPYSSIKIWSCETMDSLQSIQGFHQYGIQNLDFSPSGQLLLSVGTDLMHSIAVYNWKEGNVIFTTHLTSKIVLDCRFLGSDDYFGACGNGFVHFWRSGDFKCSTYKRERGIFGRVTKRLVTCVASVAGKVISGGRMGEICVWEGRSCVRTLHEASTSGSITCLCVVSSGENIKGGFCTSTDDGNIFLWNENLELLASYSVSTHHGIGSNHVISLCWDPNATKILIGLRCSSLLEMNEIDGSIIGTVFRGHCLDLSGLATHPFKDNVVATTGGDKNVCLWDTDCHSITKSVELQSYGSCLSFSSDGNMLAIGLGALKCQDESRADGIFLILNSIDFTVIHEGRNSKKTLLDCKYSKNGNLLAFSSADHFIYIYEVKDYSLIIRIKGHDSPVNHFDFGCAQDSNCASFVQSNSVSGEAMFWDIKGKRYSPSSQRNTHFETQTCPLSWTLNDSLSSPSLQKDEKNNFQACDRSNNECTLAVVNDTGKVFLYKYPVIAKKSYFSTYFGHAGRIGNVKFSNSDKWLFTVGSDDCCLFQWKYATDTTDSVRNESKEPGTVTHFMDNIPLFSQKLLKEREIATDEGMDFVFEFEKNVENNTAIRPWFRSIVPPSKHPLLDQSQPFDKLSLKWVHGYSGSNLFYGEDGEVIIYSVGRTLVVYDAKKHNQSFYQTTEEITCIALHPSQRIVAVGQFGTNSKICCISYKTMECTLTLKHYYRHQAVSILKFDTGGKYLVSINLDDFNTMTIFDYENATIVATTQTTPYETFDIDFNKDGTGSTLVHTGDNFIRFWRRNGRNLIFKDAVLHNRGKLQKIYAIGWDGNCPVVGTSDGHLYRFFEEDLERKVKAHNDAVISIHSTNEGIVTGSEGGIIKIWGNSLICRSTISTSTIPDLINGSCSIKSIFWDNEQNNILVGTGNSEIWKFSSSPSFVYSSQPIVQNHSKSIWGISIHPKEEKYVTVGDDKTIRLWCLRSNTLLKAIQIEMESRACVYSPDGSMIAVGFGQHQKLSSKECHGKLMIMLEDTEQILFETRDSRKMITELKWSSCGNHIAMGSFDNKIYLYHVFKSDDKLSTVTLSSTIDKHKSYITSIDFSHDSKFIQATCGSFELKYYEVDTGSHILEVSRLKDVSWESQTCALGWPMQGVWSPYDDGIEIECVDAKNASLLVTGNNHGVLKLFRYPCVSKLSRSQTYQSHSGRVGKVRWIQKGPQGYLISVGSDDNSIMVWQLLQRESVLQNYSMCKEVDKTTQISSSHCRKIKKFVPPSTLIIDEKGMSRPWLASVVAPSDSRLYKEDNVKEVAFVLSSVFGFESEYATNNVLYNYHGDVIFPAGSTVITFDRSNFNQRIYAKHNDIISAIAINGRFVASGSTTIPGDRPRINIWDSQTCVHITKLKDFHRKGIESLDFSKDGKKLVSLGFEREHWVCIWVSNSGEWFDYSLDQKIECGLESVMFVRVLNTIQHHDDYRVHHFVTGGIDHLKFWKNKTPTNVYLGEIEGKGKNICGEELADSKFITGTSTGYVHVWIKCMLTISIKAHQKGVNCFHVFENGFISGGLDGCIMLWSNEVEIMTKFDLVEASIQSLYTPLERLDCNFCPSKILFGTNKSQIFELSVKTRDVLLVSEFHYKGCTQGLAVHPTKKETFATCGDDGQLCLWDTHSIRTIRKIYVDHCLTVLAFSNSGDEILVGCGNNKVQGNSLDGLFFLVCSKTLNIKLKNRDIKYTITAVKYSPDDNFFAVAAMDYNIYIYKKNLKHEYLLLSVCESHNAAVYSLDFSEDSNLIQSASADYEYFRHTINGDLVTLPSQLKDVQWNTWTCMFGWDVQGIWKRNHITPTGHTFASDEPACVDRSPSNDLLAVGTKNGEVQLFKYPAVSEKCLIQRKLMHSGQVASCCFNYDGSIIITLGKHDRTVVIWRILH